MLCELRQIAWHRTELPGAPLCVVVDLHRLWFPYIRSHIYMLASGSEVHALNEY